VLSLLLRTGFTWLSRRRLPHCNGTLKVPALEAPVDIIRDRWGVPHIYASNMPDVLFAQGFVHAQDRLWQMELNRRLACGRLSELFGEVALNTDRTVRTLGFERLARSEWTNTSTETRDVLMAYAAGINAFLQHPSTRLPIEFKLLRHSPELWQPADILSFSYLMSWQLSPGWYSELVSAMLLEAVGEEHAAELAVRYPPAHPTTLPDGIEFNRLTTHPSLADPHDPFLRRGQGSNAWVLSGAKTPTGKPLLCNDPHLRLTLPGIWYENHLVAGPFNVTGASVPGAPLVTIGHNAHIAWGVTVAFTDGADVFIEQFDPEQPQRYKFRNQWLEAEVIAESIQVKGRVEPHIEPVVITQHGPLISDVLGYPDQRLALNATALRPSPSVTGWLRLNQARNWSEFVQAVEYIEAPPLNIVYADVDGNIGYWVTGKVPIRAHGDGRLPVTGWSGDSEWTGEVPFADMPHALNPQQGYVVSCNHRIVPDTYPHALGDIWANGYRARRVTEVLAGKEIVTVDDCRGLQLDVTCIPGLELRSCLHGLTTRDPDVQTALNLLHAWDGQLTASSVGGTLYEVTRFILVRNLLEPALGHDLTTHVMGQAFPPLLAGHEFYGHDTVTVLRLLHQPASWWVKQAGGRQAVLIRSLKQAVAWIRQELGSDVHNWQWGNLHRATFIHAMGVKKPLGRVFNRGPWPIGGDTDTPLQTATLPGAPYACNFSAPSYRQIVDLGDWSRSLAIMAPGQSGHLGSQHYDDLIAPWLTGTYHPMLWTRAQVEREAEATLFLHP
jgi:penicillin amidase